jgi:hypothetical protein
LEDQGFGASRVNFEDDKVRVDDDMMFDRNTLLMEATGELELEATEDPEHPELAQKGYRYTRVAPKSMCFAFAAGVSAAWKDAFRRAFTAWTNVGACVRLSECGAQTTITVGEAGTAADGTPAAAIADYPRYISPLGTFQGQYIIIDTSVAKSTNTTFMRRTALHELGHSIGMTHPRDGALITGTQSSTSGCNTGGCIASYPTVMDYNFATTSLSADDQLSLRKLYPKSVVRGSVTPVCIW